MTMSDATYMTAKQAASAPRLEGQIKADRTSGTYLLPNDPDYAQTHSNVMCFDAELEAVAAGFRARR